MTSVNSDRVSVRRWAVVSALLQVRCRVQSVHQFRLNMARRILAAGEVARLVKAAAESKKHSYSPYSKFRVGAALLTEDDKIITGEYRNGVK